MKIIITGINGMLGTELSGILERKHDIYGIDIAGTASTRNICKVDLTDSKAAYDAIVKINPDLVIHTAAATNVDKCEGDHNSAFLVNAMASRNVALACQRFDTAMLYISTDYVFSGQNAPENGYTEFDAPEPISVYGSSKYAGEQYVKSLLNKYYIVRTSWLFGHLRTNLISQTAEYLKAKKVVKSVTDMVSSPTNVKDLSEAISVLIESGLYGTYHLCNPGFASRHEISEYICKAIKADKNNIKKVKLSALKLPAKRPEFSAMKNFTWELNGFKPLRHWKESVSEFLKEKGC